MSLLMAIAAGRPSPYRNLTAGSAADISASPSNARGEWRFNPDGTCDILRLALGNILNVTQWYTPTGGTPGATHWIRFTPTSGTPGVGGPTGTWLPLNVAQTLGESQSSPAPTDSCTFTVEIATDSGGVNIVVTVPGFVASAREV